MRPYLKILWHFGGLAMAMTGAWMLVGWYGGAIVFGLWSVFSTMFDEICDRIG
jgi:hypothetical protein